MKALERALDPGGAAVAPSCCHGTSGRRSPSATREQRGPLAGLSAMRMRGLEPPPGCPDTDLNRARLPIPPHPRAGGDAKISHPRRRAAEGGKRRSGHGFADLVWHYRADTGLERFASLGSVDRAPLSSRGLGRRPLMAETRVRIPVAVLLTPRVDGAFRVSGA